MKKEVAKHFSHFRFSFVQHSLIPSKAAEEMQAVVGSCGAAEWLLGKLYLFPPEFVFRSRCHMEETSTA